MYENKVIIIGRLTRKPELKDFQGGHLASLNIAVNSVWFDKETQEKKESTEFISATVFGKPADNCAQYLDKGQMVYVEGKIKNRVEEVAGEKRYHTGIVAERVQFGSKAGESKQDTTSGSYQHPKVNTGPSSTNKSYDALDKVDYPEEQINAEDIPF